MSKKNCGYGLIAIVLLIVLGACSLEKGYDALQVYNYFEAKKQLEKSIGKKQESPAAYGLSVIYYRNDNPFHNMDSAYRMSLLSIAAYDSVKPKIQEKWKEKLDYSLTKAKEQRKLITTFAFHKTIQKNTVNGFDNFIANYGWSTLIPDAKRQRDSLAFLNTQAVNTSKGYADYLTQYPKSVWYDEAKSKMYKEQYKETVVENKTESYVHFIQKYPNNPLKRDAEYQIYSIETSENSIKEYAKFVTNYPKSPFVNDAWKQLYRLSIANYSQQSILTFRANYPNFPFPAIIKKDLALVGKQLLPFYKKGNYGFINLDGKVAILPKFGYAGSFHDGLALVIKDKKYGYIDKEGRVLIDYQYDNAFDFSHGRAVVVKDGKYGIIDVTGKYSLPPKYLDIGSFSDGLAYVQSKKGYQYYTLDCSVAFSAIFDEAFSFNDGLAHVKKGDKEGFIGKDGLFVVSVKDGAIRRFSDAVFVQQFNDSACFISSNDTSKIRKCFDQIGVLKDNRAIVSRGDKYGYVNNKGEIVIPLKMNTYPNYFQFSEFKNGHALIQRMGKYGLIDSLGNQFYPAIFKNIGIYGKLTPVTKGKGWGYANDDVQLKIHYNYDYAGNFVNNRAIVEEHQLYGVINTKGKVIIPIQYDDIQRLKNHLFRVESAGKVGVLSVDGKIVVPLNYTKITKISPTIYRLINNQSINYYDISQHKLIIPDE